MNTKFKRVLAAVSLVVLLMTVAYVPMEANAANEFYGDYTDAGMVYDYGSCPSMQGLAVGSQMLYTVKIGSNDSLAFISMTDKDTGTTTKLYNSDAGSYYFNYLGHANDMDVWGIDGYSHLFVTSTNEGSNAIVRLKRVGNTLTKVASYSLTYNGNPTCATALAIKSVSGGVITFITKLGMNLYTGSVSTSATSANIELTKLCTISKSRVYIKGSYVDLSNFVNQGFGYYNNTLFVPVTGDDTQLNRSVIMVFDLSNPSGTIYPTEALVFRVTSSYYSALFEIESCDICSGDGKLYFNTNRRRTNSNTNHDGVSSVDGYVFETLPVNAPTSAPKFTIQYHANGGTGTMANTTVTYGVATALRSNAFTRTGYTFKGWTAYRTAQNQWYYTNGTTTGWYTEGSQPAGYTKYLYGNGVKVAATSAVADDVVHMYAQWTPASYTVTFKNDDGTVLKSSAVSHGTVPTAPANPVKAADGRYSYTFAGWSPAVKAATANATYTATYTATALDTSKATGSIPAYLDHVDSASELTEGVPYIISDYKDSWKHYVLTSQAAQKIAGSKTHQGFLLDGTASVDTADLWYIKDGYLVYGAADSNQYLHVSYDASSQGKVVMGNFNASTAAYVKHYWNDDFAVRSTTHFLNRYGGTVNDNVAAAYTSAGGSYWHFDRLVEEQTVTLSLKAEQNTVLAGCKTLLTPEVKVNGVAADSTALTWTSSNSAVAAVSSNGTVTGMNPGKATLTATLTSANGYALAESISVKVTLTVTANTVSASTVQGASLIKTNTLQTGVPYVITEKNSGDALTGIMAYKTDADYKGLNSLQGLKTVDAIDLNNAPVWYYDGTHLRYGAPTGTNNYLVYNSSNQVALGTVSQTNIFDKVVLYSASNKTFNIYPSNKGTGYYVNQMGGANYNVAGLYSSAYYSQWHFSQLLPGRTVTLTVKPGKVALSSGDTVSLAPIVAVDGSTVSDYALSWSSSNESVAVVSSNGTVTANGNGEAVITASLTSADGRALDSALTLKITVQVSAGAGHTVTSVQAGRLEKVGALRSGVPYVVTEKNTGVALSGDMIYTTDADYCGLNGTQGLKLISNPDLNDAPVWYYDGTHLLYGSTTGSNNYLVYNSAGQVALGSVNEAGIFDRISLYSTSNKTFLLYPSAKSSGSTNYYLNQLGGGNYNAANVWSSASTSQWHFSKLVPEKTVTMKVTPTVSELTAGQSVALTASVSVNGEAASDYALTWSTSDASVATVANGTVTAVASGCVTVTATLTAHEGDAFTTPVVIEIPITVAG